MRRSASLVCQAQSRPLGTRESAQTVQFLRLRSKRSRPAAEAWRACPPCSRTRRDPSRPRGRSGRGGGSLGGVALRCPRVAVPDELRAGECAGGRSDDRAERATLHPPGDRLPAEPRQISLARWMVCRPQMSWESAFPCRPGSWPDPALGRQGGRAPGVLPQSGDSRRGRRGDPCLAVKTALNGSGIDPARGSQACSILDSAHRR